MRVTKRFLTFADIVYDFCLTFLQGCDILVVQNNRWYNTLKSNGYKRSYEKGDLQCHYSIFLMFQRLREKILLFALTIQLLEAEKNELTQKLSSLEASITPEMKDIIEAKKIIAELSEQKQQAQKSVEQANAEIESKNKEINEQQEKLAEQQQQLSDSENKIERNKQRIKSIVYCIKSIQAYYEKFELSNPLENEISYIEKHIADIDCSDVLNPTVELTLHHSSIKELKKQFKAIDNSIEKVLSEYEKRYTTKSNLAIYRLMVIALRAELQNVLYVLKYQK